ncbi:hypothetical protein [Oceanibium sediminis]|uniref:hypothetical protein n=1 Tax=Oceanibium sediminis TaxID=2026339 RepID=UPI000DD3AA48|nr:hypothetical protein [Oceanibium sediminis]
MTLAHLVIILVATLMGGGVAGLLWWAFNRLTAATPPLPPFADTPADTGADRGPPADIPIFPDPTLPAQIAAIRGEMQTLAQTQSDLLAGMTRWENQLLAEMRAIAKAGDPEVILILNRIALAVGAAPLRTPQPGDAAQDATGDAEPSGEAAPDRPP